MDGLDCYRQLIPAVLGHLAPGGWLIVEVGIGQADQVSELVAAAGFADCFVAKDPAGIDRVVGGRIS